MSEDMEPKEAPEEVEEVASGPVTLTVEQYLRVLARDFANASRQGSIVDEPEGSRYITLSDTYVRTIVQRLWACANWAKTAAMTPEEKAEAAGFRVITPEEKEEDEPEGVESST